MEKEIMKTNVIKPDFFVCGKTGSGKDTISDYLKNYFGYYKFRLADTIKRIICEKHNISFEELEELKRTNPEFRDAHTDTGDFLGKQSSINRIDLLINRKALDWTNLDNDNNFVICDVRDDLEASKLLDSEIIGIFLSRTTNEYVKETHWTEQNLFTNGKLVNLIKEYDNNKFVIVLNGEDKELEDKFLFDLSQISYDSDLVKLIEFEDTESEKSPSAVELLNKIDELVSKLIEEENE